MIKILEVNEIDLIGSRWNGYDMIRKLSDNEFSVKQAVTIKLSDDNNVICLNDTRTKRKIYERLYNYEYEKSIKNVLSLSSPLLIDTKEYKEADIIHFHAFHNSKMSLLFLEKIASEKKVILSLHDPWFLTGRCVHPFECEKWVNGCSSCENMGNYFPFKEDNCNSMWNLKKEIFKNIQVDLVYASSWMENLVSKSPILKTQKSKHLIPFGIDYQKFNSISYEEAREKLNIPKDSIVLFLRAQNEFKGTNYVVDALKELDTDKDIVVLTCDNVGLLDSVKDKYKVIDLGKIKEEDMIVAMNACDMFLMPSIGESFGFMAVEAMACGKCVLVFDNSALPSVTHAPDVGYLVKNLDSHDLSFAIKHLINNKKELEERGKKAREIVKNEYSNEVYYESLRKLYRDVYKKKNNNKINDKKVNDNSNSEQFKFYLNDLSVIVLGYNKYSKSLLYDMKDTLRDNNYKPDYNDLALQKLIIDYCFKISKVSLNNIWLNNSIFYQLGKIFYYLKYNPNYIISKIKR